MSEPLAIPTWVWKEVDLRAGNPQPNTSMEWARYSDRLRCVAAELILAHEEEQDPLLQSARRIAYDIRKCIGTTDLQGVGDVSAAILSGKWDDHQLVRAAYEGIKRGMELERSK